MKTNMAWHRFTVLAYCMLSPLTNCFINAYFGCDRVLIISWWYWLWKEVISLIQIRAVTPFIYHSVVTVTHSSLLLLSFSYKHSQRVQVFNFRMSFILVIEPVMLTSMFLPFKCGIVNVHLSNLHILFITYIILHF